MRSPEKSLLAVPLVILLATVGCSRVNVEAKDETQAPHEKIFREEMKGRSVDYQKPRALEIPPARYPVEAVAEALSGMIMIRVLVGQDGQVAEAEVVQGLHPALDAAALEAARGGRYAPATENAIATDGWLTVPFRYPPPARD